MNRGYTVTYSGNNRTHMIRIPESGRFELRLADGARRLAYWQRDSTGSRTNAIRSSVSISTCIPAATRLGIVKTLPLNLLAALRALDASEVLKPALGAFPPAYIKLKTEEWNAYARHLTQWERDTTLAC